MAKKAEWSPPFTPKRYLHPPFAEHMLTMWPDLRVMSGPIVEQTCHYRSSAFRILYGAELEPPDFEAVQYETRGDGVPIHAIRQKLGPCEMRMESFGAFPKPGTRVPGAYTRFTLTNTSDVAVEDTLAILPRTGREDHLVGLEVDGYDHYDNNVHNWGFLVTAWQPLEMEKEHILLSDGEYSLRLQKPERLTCSWKGDVPGPWAHRRLLRVSYRLAAGESVQFDVAFRFGAIEPFDYDALRAADEQFWLGELKRVKHWPGQPEHQPMVRSIVLQCLQMFCYPVGKNYVLPRQGGLQRVIWPCEAMEYLMALDRIGDFCDYTNTAYETYFFQLQDKEGEHAGAVRNLSGNQWGSITGGSCWSCAYHLLAMDNRALFDHFRDSLYLAFGWMQRMRARTLDADVAGKGLFPAMQSCDWPGVYQNWCYTDGVNLEGYRHLALLFEHFNDPAASEIRAAYEDYFARMCGCLERELAKNDRSDEILLTASLGVPMTDPPSGAYFSDGPGMLLRCGVMKPGSEAMRLLENYFRNRGCMKNGLTGLMNDGMLRQGANSDPYAGHTWYTSFSDLYWYYAWLQTGEYEKARETLEAQFKYGMSPEFYLNERYADNDPYWVPWCPNASANGRLLNMLCDSDALYAKEK